MEEALNLTIEQKLQQRLTPLQVQFVRMLEMTGPEVEEEIRRVVDENPALEVVSHEQDDIENNNSFNESAEEMQRADYSSEDDIPNYRLEARNYSADDKYYEPIAVASSDTLIDSLSSQLSELELTPKQQAIAKYIIGSLDDNGYITRNLNNIAYDIEVYTGYYVTNEEMRDVLTKIQALDPAGVAAVDLRECLLLQLRRRNKSEINDIAIEIIADYFDLFSKKHFDKLKSMLNISSEQLQEAFAIIKSLNPKPGGILDGATDDRSRHIIPDFQVETDGDSLSLTLLNNIPDLQIEQTFTIGEPIQNMSRQQREAQLFVKQKRDEANGFISIIKKRQETLYNIMTAIIKLQQDFFLNEDDEALIRPMILKDVAAITGYDLSVISRATAGKYVTTQYGTYPLKLFFNERPKEEDDVSTHEILAVLKDIISKEDKQHPLSDESITSLLKEKKYDIARRTVAKYREKLGIPVARLRKEMK